MKARLIPVYFQSGMDDDFVQQVAKLQELLALDAQILEPIALGSPLPEADAVVFPQMLGDAYRQVPAIRAIGLPLLVITSEFGTLSMWDWEIASYLRAEGIDTIAPYNLEQARKLCRGLGVKSELQQSKFLVFQDNPGQGFQADIFKRFYWWEDECNQRIFDKFGLTIVKKSFKELGAQAKAIPDQEVMPTREAWGGKLKAEDVSERGLNSALKLYLAVKHELEKDQNIKAVGINCLNESHFSDTTPCLAWHLLYEEFGIIWGCEADTVSMLTKHILSKSLGKPLMMTNLYPFLLGHAALKHERIPDFPSVNNPENHILVAHCGYLGVLPQSFATDWRLQPKVLSIVNDNAIVIDARMRSGDITLAKLSPNFESLSVVEGSLNGYVQYADSDCLNGAVLEVPNGHKLISSLTSHHYILMEGHNLADIEMLARLYDLEVEVI